MRCKELTVIIGKSNPSGALKYLYWKAKASFRCIVIALQMTTYLEIQEKLNGDWNGDFVRH